ncbi:MAG: hypothetical protein GTN49_02595, partial [candidate division Zixibacteria bacterium]|nr:hypothetical protein [candidate division Zixibacteria bacterium]
MADGPARGLTAYNLAFGKFELFQTHQFQPLHIWVWAALLRVFGDIYWTGTALNVAAGAGTALFMYLLGRQLAGPVAGSVAALAFIFSPVHHNLTIAMGMAASLFFFWVAAGIYAAARATEGGRGAVAAGFCLAAAALTRYEGALLLVLYSAYLLFRSRPRGVAAWSLWAAPLALAGLFLGHKLLVGTIRGFAGAWVFSALKADTADVLSNLRWYRRTYYGLERLWFDGRLVAVLGMFGAVMVWARRLRDERRLVIWAGPAALFVGLTAVAVFLGVGFAAERYFATVLMLLFPFAGLAVVEVWRRAKGKPAKVAVASALVAAAAYTVYFDAKDYETGLVEPWHWSQINDAELALKLRELWRRGELGPNEIIYMEEN